MLRTVNCRIHLKGMKMEGGKFGIAAGVVIGRRGKVIAVMESIGHAWKPPYSECSYGRVIMLV